MCPNLKLDANSTNNYLVNHEASLGTLLAAYGAFYLTTVIMGGWTTADWGRDVFIFSNTAIQPVMPSSFISPLFFVTSIPTLLIGIFMLCDYSIRSIRFGLTVDSKRVSLLLAAFGLAYITVGAWPLQAVVNMPWDWQKQIMSYGPVFAWGLYLLGAVVLAVGGVSLYVHSRDFYRRNPQLSNDY